jgi:hypothetical protein
MLALEESLASWVALWVSFALEVSVMSWVLVTFSVSWLVHSDVLDDLKVIVSVGDLPIGVLDRNGDALRLVELDLADQGSHASSPLRCS